MEPAGDGAENTQKGKCAEKKNEKAADYNTCTIPGLSNSTLLVVTDID